MGILSTKVFIDADIFVALAKKDDSNHLKSVEWLDLLIKQKACFLTSNYAFAEAVTVISRHLGRRAAIGFINEIKSGDVKMVFVDEEIEAIAIEIYKEQTSKNVSFMDCAHMACIKHFNLDAIFSFDHIYIQNRVPHVKNLF